MATKAVKLPSGNYRVRGHYTGADGKQHYKSFTDPSKNRATFLAVQFENSGKQVSVSNLTVGDAIDCYINDRTSVLSPATIREYRRMRRNYFKSLMPLKLRALTPQLIQRAINIDASRVSPKTVRNAYGILTPTLSLYAPDINLRDINLPQRVKKEIVVPEEQAVQLLLKATEGTALHSAILIEAFGGLRRSEISALLVSDVDSKACTITVNKAVVLNDSKQWVQKATKSYAGTRTVKVPQFVIDSILSGHQHQDEPLVGLVPDSITRLFREARISVGLTCRFHDLRHFTASIMLALGVPDKYAMEIMGHSSPDMLKRVYQHTMQSKRSEVTDKVVAYFEKYDMKSDTPIT